MDISEKLKPCPFCGGDASIGTTNSTIDGPGTVYGICDVCKSQGGYPQKHFWLMETDSRKIQEAINIWNLRV